MAWTTLTARNAGDAILASDQQAWVNNLNALRGDYASFRRTAGNITLTGTSTWSDLTTIGTGGDLTLDASSGDLVEASLFMLVGNEAVDMTFDVITVVSTTKTNSLGAAGSVPANFSAYGGAGWYAPGSGFRGISGSIFYVLQAGDISSATVKLRVQYAMASATNRTLYGSAQYPFFFCARNHGPVQT